MNGVPIPDYQKGIMAVSAATNGGSTTERNYPDVAMLAQNFEIFFSGATTVVSGTSVAAPLWAGFTALVNQQSMQNGAGLAGFLNPTLYDIGLTAGSADDLYAKAPARAADDA
jgi:subtilase family serine protease